MRLKLENETKLEKDNKTENETKLEKEARLKVRLNFVKTENKPAKYSMCWKFHPIFLFRFKFRMKLRG